MEKQPEVIPPEEDSEEEGDEPKESIVSAVIIYCLRAI